MLQGITSAFVTTSGVQLVILLGRGTIFPFVLQVLKPPTGADMLHIHLLPAAAATRCLTNGLSRQPIRQQATNGPEYQSQYSAQARYNNRCNRLVFIVSRLRQHPINP